MISLVSSQPRPTRADRTDAAHPALGSTDLGKDGQIAPLDKTSTKIVLVNRFFYPDESATAQMLTDLALHLAQEGKQVVVVTGRYSSGSAERLPSREQYRDIQIHRVFSGRTNGRSLLSKLWQYLAYFPGALVKLLFVVRRGDVVVAKTDPPLISVVAFAAAKLKRAKLVNWIQDLYPEVAAELGTPFLKGVVGRQLARVRNRALRAAKVNVTIGSTMGERLAGLGIKPQAIAIIPNWADEKAIARLMPSQSAAREAWGFAPLDFVVGYSGNLGQAHEVETLIGAANILRDETNIKFLFVGGGYHHQTLRRLIAQEKLPNFIFQPHQPRERVSDMLAAADVHWVSLRPQLEGLIVPSKLYGILAAGRPVLSICDAEGEVSRVVRDHRCGIVVQPGDTHNLAKAISSLANDPGLCEKLGERARNTSEKVFSREAALRAWSKLLSSVSGTDTSPERHYTVPG